MGCVECMVNSRGVLASEVVQKVLSSCHNSDTSVETTVQCGAG